MPVRAAVLTDLDSLVQVEQRCFQSDRLSRRSFRHFLTRGKASVLVFDDAGEIAGYALTLFHAGTALARLYSFAVLPEKQGKGIGRALLEAAEREARQRRSVAIRLEIRRDNERAKALYQAARYRELETLDDYYEDHESGIRMQKILAPDLRHSPASVPYYRQTLEFTCGPAALMMAMRHLTPRLALTRRLELQLWREATTIFMTTGHGGCDPYGLALAAKRRGYDVEVILKDDQALFVDSVRSAEKKAVIELVHRDFQEQIEAARIPIRYGSLALGELKDRIETGEVPVILISSYRLYGEKVPHWVVVTGVGDDIVYLHDPYVDDEENRSVVDAMNIPINREEFEGMARYGRSGQRAAVILSRRRTDE